MAGLAPRPQPPGYLIHHGPVPPQESWKENSGYSLSTLAAHIAALICAAAFARERGEQATPQYIEEYADFLEAHLELWTVTMEGSLFPNIRRHFIRIRPANASISLYDNTARQFLSVAGIADRTCTLYKAGMPLHSGRIFLAAHLLCTSHIICLTLTANPPILKKGERDWGVPDLYPASW